MTTAETLKHEHKIILKVLEAAERELRLAREKGRVEPEKLAKMLDFFRNFADRCHHAKEEKLLFPVLREKEEGLAVPMIEQLLWEHESGREMVKAAAERLAGLREGDPSTMSSLPRNLAYYIELLRTHIEKEDTVMLFVSEQLLTPDDERSLQEAFERVETEEIGRGVHEKYHQLAHELEH